MEEYRGHLRRNYLHRGHQGGRNGGLDRAGPPYAGDLPDAGNWKDFVDFAATRIPTIDDKTGTLIGLKSDGTVVDSGYFSQKYPVMWNAGLTLAFKNVAMSASTYHAVF